MPSFNKILLIGASGRLGRMIAKVLGDRGHRVVLHHRREMSLDQSLCSSERLQFDLRDTSKTSSVCEKFPLVIYAAGASAYLASSEFHAIEKFQEVNVDSVRAVCKGVLQSSGRLLYIGSLFSLGMPKDIENCDQQMAEPCSAFEISKAEGEQIIKLSIELGMQADILRLAPVIDIKPVNKMQLLLLKALNSHKFRKKMQEISDEYRPATFTEAVLVKVVRSVESESVSGICNVYSKAKCKMFWQGIESCNFDVNNITHSEEQFLNRFIRWKPY